MAGNCIHNFIYCFTYCAMIIHRCFRMKYDSSQDMCPYESYKAIYHLFYTLHLLSNEELKHALFHTASIRLSKYYINTIETVLAMPSKRPSLHNCENIYCRLPIHAKTPRYFQRFIYVRIPQKIRTNTFQDIDWKIAKSTISHLIGKVSLVFEKVNCFLSNFRPRKEDPSIHWPSSRLLLPRCSPVCSLQTASDRVPNIWTLTEVPPL